MFTILLQINNANNIKNPTKFCYYKKMKVMQKTLIASKVIIINSEGLILVIRRSKTDPRKPLTWDLPGGFVEKNEDPTEAVIRETFEEIGIHITNPRIIHISSYIEEIYLIRLVYYVIDDNEEVELSYEHDDYKWVNKNNYLKLNNPDFHKDALKYIPEELLTIS